MSSFGIIDLAWLRRVSPGRPLLLCWGSGRCEQAPGHDNQQEHHKQQEQAKAQQLEQA
jgi:hypothetical protein